MTTVCPKCAAVDPPLAVQLKEIVFRTCKATEATYEARLPRKARCLRCQEISLVWHFNPTKRKNWLNAIARRKKGGTE